MLLHYCILEPVSNLAAIRFASPVHVHSIRVFPTGARPFTGNADIVARTEPEAFFLDVFFNAHPVQSDVKQKQKAVNALVPTVIAYAGGKMEFKVDMGNEFATRLVIIKGPFQCVSMAIYGDLATEHAPPTTYEPLPMSSTELSLLSRPVDPSNSTDPTFLARQLLRLIPDSPPLSLIIRLMLCLKPSNDDWELPEFPYIFANLDDELADLDLDQAFHSSARPVRDDLPTENLQVFAEKVAHLIGPKDSYQAYLVAGILRHAASQHPGMARLLVQHLDLSLIFETSNLDEATLLRLLDAATNPDISRYLNNDWFLELLRSIQRTPGADHETQLATRRLAARIREWQILEDALSNTQGDFNRAATMMKDIGTEEQSFGIWLESMITNPELVLKLAENPVLPVSQGHPPLLLGQPLTTVSHDEFISFVRAYIGVSSVFAVYAWADSLPNHQCRERTLGILRLWQTVNGYREIVNHLLLLPQMTFRLECMCMATEDDPPSQSGIHAEGILVGLAHDPQAILNQRVIKAILSLVPPLSYITEEDRLLMRKMALLANDGLSAAIEDFTLPNDCPMDIRRLRTLRVSLAVVERELSDGNGGEWRILESLWKEQLHGLVPHLVDVFIEVCNDLKSHFNLTPPPPMGHELVNHLFRAAADILKMVTRLAPAYPITRRSIRILTVAVADVFVCTDAADMLYAQTSDACIAAQDTRQTCIDLVRALSDPCVYTEPRNNGAEVVLRTLLEQGVRSDGADPAYRLLQVFSLIDLLLPSSPPGLEEDNESHWIMSVLPNVLPELQPFFRILDTENKVHFIKRLVNLDRGLVGIGEWLFLEELRELVRLMQSSDDDMMEEHVQLLGHHQAFLTLRFILDLVTTPSNASTWCINAIETVPDISHALMECLMGLLNGRVHSLHVTQIVQVLADRYLALSPGLRFAIVLTLYRSVQTHVNPDNAFHLALRLLQSLPTEAIDSNYLPLGIGRAIAALPTSPLEPVNESLAEVILLTLEWLSEQSDSSVAGITSDQFSNICCDQITEALPASRTDKLPAVLSKINVVPSSPSSVSVALPPTLSLSVDAIADLLRPPIPIPSTPKRAMPEEVFNLVTISPPTALLRSPGVITGLTKTYLNNDFRQLRNTPGTTRQNTSRLPSMHVDDFQLSASSPPLVPATSGDVLQTMPLSPTYSINSIPDGIRAPPDGLYKADL